MVSVVDNVVDVVVVVFVFVIVLVTALDFLEDVGGW